MAVNVRRGALTGRCLLLSLPDAICERGESSLEGLMREESLVTAVYDCADVSRVCEEECGTWRRSVLSFHRNWFEVIDTPLGRCSILASCRQLQFTCAVYAQSTPLRYGLRCRSSGRHTALWFPLELPEKNLPRCHFFQNSAQNHKIVRRERRL